VTITRSNQFQAKASREESLHAFLQSVISDIETCPGCLSCKPLRSVDNPACLAIIEQGESIEAHQSAASAIPPEKLAEVAALFARPPAGIYYRT